MKLCRPLLPRGNLLVAWCRQSSTQNLLRLLDSDEADSTVRQEGSVVRGEHGSDPREQLSASKLAHRLQSESPMNKTQSAWRLIGVGFAASSMFGAVSLPVPGNQDCFTQINQVGASFFIKCSEATCDDAASTCAVRSSQIGSTFYFQCFCDMGKPPICNGYLKSNSGSASDPGYAVLCIEAEPGCPALKVCDEVQLDADESTFEQLCKCVDI